MMTAHKKLRAVGGLLLAGLAAVLIGVGAPQTDTVDVAGDPNWASAVAIASADTADPPADQTAVPDPNWGSPPAEPTMLDHNWG